MKQIVLLLIGCLVIHNGIAGPKRKRIKGLGRLGIAGDQFDQPVARDLHQLRSARRSGWFESVPEYEAFKLELTTRLENALGNIGRAEENTERAYFEGWKEYYRVHAELDVAEIEYWRNAIESRGWPDCETGVKLKFPHDFIVAEHDAINASRRTDPNARKIDIILDESLLPEWCQNRSALVKGKVYARMLSAYESAMHFHDILSTAHQYVHDQMTPHENVTLYGKENAKLLFDLKRETQLHLIDIHRYSSLACQSFLQADERSSNNYLQSVLEAENAYDRITDKSGMMLYDLSQKHEIIRVESYRLPGDPPLFMEDDPLASIRFRIKEHSVWFDEFGTDLFERFTGVRRVPNELLIGEPQINGNAIKFLEAWRMERIAPCSEPWESQTELRLGELKDASLDYAAAADYWKGLYETQSAEVLMDVLPRLYKNINVSTLADHEMNTIRNTFLERSIACRKEALTHARDFYEGARALQEQRLRDVSKSPMANRIKVKFGPESKALYTELQTSRLQRLVTANTHAEKVCHKLLRAAETNDMRIQMRKYERATTHLQLLNRELASVNQSTNEHYFGRIYTEGEQHVPTREWREIENARLSEVRLYNPYFDHPGSPHQEALRTRERIIEEHHSTNREITPEQGNKGTALRNVGIGVGAVCAIAALVYAGYEIYNLCTHDQNTQDTPERYIPQETRSVESFVPNPLELGRSRNHF